MSYKAPSQLGGGDSVMAFLSSQTGIRIDIARVYV